MNLSQLEYFVASVREGGYANAARKLYVTTQTISKSIRELESELGVSLMMRSGRGIKPTPLGLFLADQSTIILEECAGLKQSVVTKRGAGKLCGRYSVAVCTADCRGDLYPARFFRMLNRSSPGLSFDVVYGFNDSCCELLKNGLVDMALALDAPFQEGDIKAQYIAALKPKFAVAPNHPLAEGGRMTFAGVKDVVIAVPLAARSCLPQLNHFLLAKGVRAHFESVRLNARDNSVFLNKGGIVMVLNDEPTVLSDTKRLVLSQSGNAALRLPVYLYYRETNRPAMLDEIRCLLRETGYRLQLP